MNTSEIMAFVPAVGLAAVAVLMAWLIGRTGSKKDDVATTVDKADENPKKNVIDIDYQGGIRSTYSVWLPVDIQYTTVLDVSPQPSKPREQTTH